MARAVVTPDVTQPFAKVTLVRIDLARVALHFVLGTIEPVAVKGTPPLQRPGAIPQADQAPDRLLAAFNGGFKSVHGNYGVYDQGTTLVPMLDGIATLAIYKDGSIKLGAWGRDITMTQDLLTARQGCPLLVDKGQINPKTNDNDHRV